MDWVEEFYSVTGRWWGPALAKADDVDRLRAELVDRLAPEESIPHEGSIEFVRADFYTVEFGRVFDVVCYWDGFGVGSDDDQIRLLRRIAHDWLAPDGRAIIEVFDPAGWAADDGLVEIKEPAPERGYEHRLGHCRSFETATSTAVDAWWEVGSAQIYAQRFAVLRARRVRRAGTTRRVDARNLRRPRCAVATRNRRQQLVVRVRAAPNLSDSQRMNLIDGNNRWRPGPPGAARRVVPDRRMTNGH